VRYRLDPRRANLCARYWQQYWSLASDGAARTLVFVKHGAFVGSAAMLRRLRHAKGVKDVNSHSQKKTKGSVKGIFAGTAMAASLLAMSLVGPARAVEVPVEYLADLKQFSTVQNGDTFTFELYDDSACLNLVHSQAIDAGSASLLVEQVKANKVSGQSPDRPRRSGSLRCCSRRRCRTSSGCGWTPPV